MVCTRLLPWCMQPMSVRTRCQQRESSRVPLTWSNAYFCCLPSEFFVRNETYKPDKNKVISESTCDQRGRSMIVAIHTPEMPQFAGILTDRMI